MQLGTRWQLGTKPPPKLPDALVASIRAVESALGSTVPGSSDWRWTLTWLEGRPVVELDDGTVIRYDPTTGTAQTTQWSDEHSTSE